MYWGESKACIGGNLKHVLGESKACIGGNLKHVLGEI